MRDLRDTLKKIKDNDFIPSENTNVNEIVDEMLINIGDLDPSLRDELIYLTFAYWIMRNYLAPKKLKAMAFDLVGEEYLFYNIDFDDPETVFKRSFSVLVICLIVDSHRRNKLFNLEELSFIYEKVNHYFLKEKDNRGYVTKHGWAHTVAHTADALDELGCCQEFESDKLFNILENIKHKLIHCGEPLIDLEDERLATAVLSIINRGIISSEQLLDWLEQFKDKPTIEERIPSYYRDVNIKRFLKSLYFKTITVKDYEPFSNQLLKLINPKV